MTKYSGTLQLWDITDDERTGELVKEESFGNLSPLKDIDMLIRNFVGNTLPPCINIGSLRVSMSRNGGTGVARVRFEEFESSYRVDVRCSAEDKQTLLGAIKTHYSAPGHKTCRLKFEELMGFDWITVNYDPKMGEPAREFTGSHPLVGGRCKAVLEDTKPGRALYATEKV